MDKGNVYILRSLDLYKIGKTVNPINRLKTYSTHNPHGITEIICAKVKYQTTLERKLHNMFSKKRVKGEWFRLSDAELKTAVKEIIVNMSWHLDRLLLTQKHE